MIEASEKTTNFITCLLQTENIIIKNINGLLKFISNDKKHGNHIRIKFKNGSFYIEYSQCIRHSSSIKELRYLETIKLTISEFLCKSWKFYSLLKERELILAKDLICNKQKFMEKCQQDEWLKFEYEN